MENKSFDYNQLNSIEKFEILQQIEEDKEDYYSALKVKMINEKWTSHEDLKKELGLE